MKTRIGALTALAAALVLTVTGSAAAAPITVNVRVEGLHRTLFDRNVKTQAHTISKDSTGPHPCNGTNNGANPTPGPTVHSALDDASKAGHFMWAATWNAQFSDFFVTRIGPDVGTTATSYWTEAVNFKDTTAGGCQVELKPGAQVLFYFVHGTYPKYALKLSGPHTATAGKSIRVRVVDGRTGKPLKGAKVGGHKTNVHGYVRVRLMRLGTVQLRATLANAVRSNFLTVRVHR